MTPHELIARLESVGLIDPAVLEKVRQHVEDPEKKVKPKAVLSYLVKKEQITRTQASALLKEIEAPKPIQHEEIRVNLPKEYDTDDLTSISDELTESKPEPEPKTLRKTEPRRQREPEVRPRKERPVVEIVPVEQPAEVDPLIETADQFSAGDVVHAPLHADYGAPMDAGIYGDSRQRDDKPAPGFRGKRLKKDQWSTKWLYIGFGILGLLLIFGAVLYIAVNRVSAEDQFKAANTSFENGSYSDAIEKFNEFIEENPKHEKVNTAKVRRVQALIAQTYETKNWDETIKRAETQLPGLLEDSSINMDLIRDDLGVMLPGAALKISERALKQTDLPGMEKQLELALGAKQVVDNAAYIPNSIRKRPVVATTIDKFEDNILAVQGLIQKEYDYKAGLTEIRQLGDASKTEEAFALYQKLTRQYAELAAREELQVAMKAVSAKERELVKPTPTSLTTSSEARPSDSQSVVVLASKNGQKLDADRDVITPVLAEGTLYGIESSDGSVVWRKWLGFQTQIQPQVFKEDLLLVADQQNQDLMLLKRLDGKVVWRTEIGEPFVTPAFNDAMIVVTARSGKVFKLDAQTGKVIAAVQLPQTANVSAMIAEREPYIYQPGYYSNIYILSSEDLSCRDVYYLGHYKGSIEVPLVIWNGHLLVCVNSGSRCDLYVLKPEEQGLGLQMVQLLNRITSGPVTTPLLRFGRWMLVASDNGDLKILNIDPADEANPISKFAEEKFENRSGQRAFLLTQGNQLWIAGKGILKYRIQGSLGKFTRQLITNIGDSFVAPLHAIEEGVLHVRRREGSGMISVSAVDPNTLKEIWRTDLGGSLAGSPTVVGDEIMAISNQGDLFLLDSAAISRGYSDNAEKSSTIVESLSFDSTIALGDNRFACIGSNGRDDLLSIEGGNSRLLKLKPPADKPVCEPIAVGGDLIIASAEGPVVRVDARTGQMIGAPFQPPVKPGEKVNWKRPVLIEGEVFAIAREGVDSSPSSIFVLDSSDGKSIREVSEFAADARIKSPLESFARTVVGVFSNAENDQLVALDSANSLTSLGTATLPGNYVAGPWVVGPAVLVTLDTDELVCFDQQLQEKWKISLPPDQVAGEPVLDRGKIAFAFQNGKVVWLDPETGQEANSILLGQPVSGISFVDNKLYFGGSDGTVHVWQAQ
jgi:outer membrane protein assembly factor BamB